MDRTPTPPSSEEDTVEAAVRFEETNRRRNWFKVINCCRWRRWSASRSASSKEAGLDCE
jgi:hypothetical protein